MTKQEINKYTKYSSKLSNEEFKEIIVAFILMAFIGALIGGSVIGLIMTQGTY